MEIRQVCSSLELLLATDFVVVGTGLDCRMVCFEEALADAGPVTRWIVMWLGMGPGFGMSVRWDYCC